MSGRAWLAECAGTFTLVFAGIAAVASSVYSGRRVVQLPNFDADTWIDLVLTNGALPAMVIVDAVTRLLPGVLGDEESAKDESFSDSLLEYPQYTRPAEFRSMKVPEILLSGHHAEIETWRREQALKRTADRRPDLLKNENR